jgi:preprotein translocase SecF subunit
VRDIIGKRNWFFAFSLALTIPGLIFILLGPITNGAAGLQFSIDYTGGTKWEIRFDNTAVTPEQVQAVLATQGEGDSTVQRTTDNFLLIRMGAVGLVEASSPTPIPSVSPAPSGSPGPSGSPAASGSPAPSASASPAPSGSPAPSASPAPSGSPAPSASPAPSGSPAASAGASPSTTPSLNTPGPSFPASLPPASFTAPTPAPPGQVTRVGGMAPIVTALEAKLGTIESQRLLTTIGPVISQELTQQAILLILIGSIGILLWMTFRFHDFRFGMTALVAIVHDVLVVVGAFAILGTFFGLEVDGLFVTAMLTIIGFSVHDTIVVYDRVRENRSRHAGERFSAIVNHSILQTLARSINTSLVVIFTLSALFLFGGQAIRPFILALLIGITSGTYSSIFNAAPLLTVWEEWDARRKERASGRPVRRPSA